MVSMNIFPRYSPMRNKYTGRFYEALKKSNKVDSKYPYRNRIKTAHSEIKDINERKDLTEAQRTERVARKIIQTMKSIER